MVWFLCAALAVVTCSVWAHGSGDTIQMVSDLSSDAETSSDSSEKNLNTANLDEPEVSFNIHNIEYNKESHPETYESLLNETLLDKSASNKIQSSDHVYQVPISVDNEKGFVTKINQNLKKNNLELNTSEIKNIGNGDRLVDMSQTIKPNNSETNSSASEIIHGTRRIFDADEETTIEDYPFMAAILMNGELWCGGVIIKADLILTAAHCLQLQYNNRFYREYMRLLTVRVGSSNATAGGQLHQVQELFFHPNYAPSTLAFNFAVLKLRKEIVLTENPYKLRTQRRRRKHLRSKRDEFESIDTLSRKKSIHSDAEYNYNSRNLNDPSNYLDEGYQTRHSLKSKIRNKYRKQKAGGIKRRHQQTIPLLFDKQEDSTEQPLDHLDESTDHKIQPSYISLNQELRHENAELEAENSKLADLNTILIEQQKELDGELPDKVSEQLKNENIALEMENENLENENRNLEHEGVPFTKNEKPDSTNREQWSKDKVAKIRYNYKYEHMMPNKIIRFLGWGSVYANASQGGLVLLQRIDLPVYHLKDCQEVYGRDLVTPNNFCAGYIAVRKNVCNHDAGGPAILEGKLVGILSFSHKSCDELDKPAVFSSVGVIRSWLDNLATALKKRGRFNPDSKYGPTDF